MFEAFKAMIEEEKEKRERAEHLQRMYDVFEYMDESKIPVVLKNLKKLSFEETIDLIAKAVYEILDTPNFGIQARFMGYFLNTRQNLVIASTIANAIIFGRKLKISSSAINDNVMNVNLTIVEGEFSYSCQFFLEDSSPYGVSTVIYILFLNCIADNNLTLPVQWKICVKEMGETGLKEGFAASGTLRDIAQTILGAVKGKVTSEEYTLLKVCMDINARKHGWEEYYKEIISTDTAKIIRLH